MKKSTKVLVAGAAMAGLMSGVASRTYAYPATSQTLQISALNTSGTFGLLDESGDKGKHDCKGQNACKGQGGCKTDKNTCKGHNACKGQGGCSTMSKLVSSLDY